MGRQLNLNKSSKNVANLGSSGTQRSHYDGFRRNMNPGDHLLVREYKQTIFTCANLNMGLVTSTPLKMYLKTDNSSGRTVLRRGIELNPVSNDKKDYLASLPHLQKTLRSFVDIEEVVIHPVLALLERANDSRHINGQKLIELTQLYQEITGKAYWLVERDPILQIPKNLWIIPSQLLIPRKLAGSKNIVDHYELVTRTASGEPKKYKPEDIISFLMPNLLNPYMDGTSPLEAAFESNEVSNKERSFQHGLLAKEGRPDFIVSPKGESAPLGKDMGKVLEKEYNYRFGQGRSGGIWVPDEEVQLLPVTLPVRDLARLEISKNADTHIANAFGIPHALISGDSLSKQQLEAAEEQHAKYAGRHRLNRNATVMNDLLVSEFDDTGRLFLAYDDPVPEDAVKKTTKIVQMKSNGIWTGNECRVYDGTFGKSTDPEADKLQTMNVSPEIERDKKAKSGDDDRDKKDNEK